MTDFAYLKVQYSAAAYRGRRAWCYHLLSQPSRRDERKEAMASVPPHGQLTLHEAPFTTRYEVYIKHHLSSISKSTGRKKLCGSGRAIVVDERKLLRDQIHVERVGLQSLSLHNSNFRGKIMTL